MSLLSKSAAIAAILVCLACVAYADEDPDTGEGGEGTKIDRIFSTIAAKNGPGGAVIVIDDGRVIYKAGYGLSDIKAGTTITTKSMFHLGSIGKQFTALGIMMLSQEGRLQYDDPIGKYLPELQRFGKDLTVRRLLNHTSGIADYDEENDLHDALCDRAPEPRNADLIAVLANHGTPLFKPGAEFKYSNTGYDVLGALIEKLSGMTYARFMEQRIFSRLGMSHSFALPDPGRIKDPLLCISYEKQGGRFVPDPSSSLDNLNGSGSCYSSVEDLYLYDQALYKDTLVKQITQTDAFKDVKLGNGSVSNYGFAFENGTYQGERCVSHGGSWLAFDSFYLRFPEEKLSIFVLLNQKSANPDAEKAAYLIADIFLK
ncbi:MAG: serine hydrolase domain-containing protein [Candidatus Xenobiia bacterium LiM19]